MPEIPALFLYNLFFETGMTTVEVIYRIIEDGCVIERKRSFNYEDDKDSPKCADLVSASLHTIADGWSYKRVGKALIEAGRAFDVEGKYMLG